MTNIPLFDSHTHLNAEELFPNREKHLTDFIDAGGIGIVNIGANLRWSKRAIELTQSIRQKLPTIQSMKKQNSTVADFFAGATIGIHPSETIKFDDEPAWITFDTIENELIELKKIYGNNADVICAIGECGIDLHYPGSTDTLQLQKELLARQCQFALETGLPLVIHSRDAFQETVEVLKKYFGKGENTSLPVVFHCFGYGPKEAEYLIETFDNVYIGFDGNITYKSAQPLREAFLVTPKNKVLLETDAPYLSPIPVRGEMNTPKNIKHTYKFLADLQNSPLEELANQITENSRNFFSIL